MKRFVFRLGGALAILALFVALDHLLGTSLSRYGLLVALSVPFMIEAIYVSRTGMRVADGKLGTRDVATLAGGYLAGIAVFVVVDYLTTFDVTTRYLVAGVVLLVTTFGVWFTLGSPTLRMFLKRSPFDRDLAQ